MVNDAGQLYTIEGIAAAFLMIFTTYIVLNATTIFTPADTHVIDMQFEQLGNDALAMMDVVDPGDTTSALENYVMTWDVDGFSNTFSDYVNYNFKGEDTERPIDFNAYIIYRQPSGDVKKYPLYESMPPTDRFISAHPVTVSKWVYLTNSPSDGDLTDVYTPPGGFDSIDPRPQVALIEVTLWRD